MPSEPCHAMCCRGTCADPVRGMSLPVVWEGSTCHASDSAFWRSTRDRVVANGRRQSDGVMMCAQHHACDRTAKHVMWAVSVSKSTIVARSSVTCRAVSKQVFHVGCERAVVVDARVCADLFAVLEDQSQCAVRMKHVVQLHHIRMDLQCRMRADQHAAVRFP